MKKKMVMVWEQETLEKEQRGRTSLAEALDLSRDQAEKKRTVSKKTGLPYVISFVGAGGKTSLMYCLGEELEQDGWKVGIVTTTHIFVPDHDMFVLICSEELEAFKRNLEELEEKRKQKEKRRQTEAGCCIAAGSLIQRNEEKKKFSPLPEAFLNVLEDWADFLLVEADGSKQQPLKVPAPWEPVILPETSMVVGCVGLSSLGKPWRTTCFRAEYGIDFFQGELVTEEEIAVILTEEQGTKKAVGNRDYYIVLNQADTPGLRKKGLKILHQVRETCQKAVCTSFAVKEDR